jgi:hypothetical protein
MRTEEAERAKKRLELAAHSMQVLYQVTNDVSYYWQERGIFLAALALDIDLSGLCAPTGRLESTD